MFRHRLLLVLAALALASAFALLAVWPRALSSRVQVGSSKHVAETPPIRPPAVQVPTRATAFAAALARGDHADAAALLERWLQTNEAAALAAVASLSFEQTRFGTRLFTELSAHFDRQPARPALATIFDALASNPELLRQLAADRYREFAHAELDGAVGWLNALPVERAPIARGLAGELGAQQRSNGAIDRLALHTRLATPELRAACLRGVTDAWIEVEPLAATEALLKLPRAPEVEEVLAFAVTRVARTQPKLALELAATLSDETLRGRAEAEVAETWAMDAPDSYLAWRAETAPPKNESSSIRHRQ